MALDIIVYWKPGKMPSKADLQLVLEDYTLGVATVVWDADRFYVNLKGKPTLPFSRLDPLFKYDLPEVRWFEVWLGIDKIDVITRQTDEITNNIARGFAALCARYWQGDLEG